MASVKNVLDMKTVPVKQVDMRLPPGLLNRSLCRLPLHYLRELLPELGFPRELLGGVWSNLTHMQEVLFRATCLSGENQISTIEKSALTDAFKQRANEVQQWWVVSEALKVGWRAADVGLFEFLPPVPAECANPDSHVYKTIRCLGTEVAVQGLVVTAA
eukprot:6481764-Amphidinium_carterae.1